MSQKGGEFEDRPFSENEEDIEHKKMEDVSFHKSMNVLNENDILTRIK